MTNNTTTPLQPAAVLFILGVILFLAFGCDGGVARIEGDRLSSNIPEYQGHAGYSGGDFSFPTGTTDGSSDLFADTQLYKGVIFAAIV